MTDLDAKGPVLHAALIAAKELADLAEKLTACRGDDEFLRGVKAKIDAALSSVLPPPCDGVGVKPLDDDQIMEIIREVAPWKDEPKLNDLLTYEKSPPLFPQATYDVPSYRAEKFVRAVEKRIRSALTAVPADEDAAKAGAVPVAGEADYAAQAAYNSFDGAGERASPVPAAVERGTDRTKRVPEKPTTAMLKAAGECESRMRNVNGGASGADYWRAMWAAAQESALSIDGETEAARDVLAERRRQVEVEGWTAAHDDAHDKGELAAAAANYALYHTWFGHDLPNHIWPWEPKWWKPGDRRRDLVKAGALILAEIERLDRLSSHPQTDEAKEG